MPKVTLYTRSGCHLCDDAKQVLDSARRKISFVLEVVDIDQQEEFRQLYTNEVPVIAIDGVKAFKYKVSMDEFLKKLAARS